jgi:hypothetical protein
MRRLVSCAGFLMGTLDDLDPLYRPRYTLSHAACEKRTTAFPLAHVFGG